MLDSDIYEDKMFLMNTWTNSDGTGFFIKNSVVYNRDDLKFYSSGDFESTFIENFQIRRILS